MSKLFDDLENSEDDSSSEEAQEKPYSVSEFLDTVNEGLEDFEGAVQGEITSISKRSSYLRFKIKDEEDESILKCFMWKSDYKISGVELEEGMEIIVHGYPEIYKPYGEFSLQTETVELVGEGALMKAYKKLKKKLKKEGLFEEERKRALPKFPKKIGVITSLRGGTVIHDFENNLERFGFEIKGIDARVEGKKATKSLLSAMKKAGKLDIDVLVIIRGGGSIESLQAFDNESLVREVVDFEVPVIAGIGHHEDKTLVALAADRSESTPQGVAEMLNEPWKEARNDLRVFEKSLVSGFENMFNEARREVEEYSQGLRSNFKDIIKTFRSNYSRLRDEIVGFGHRLARIREGLKRTVDLLVREMTSAVDNTNSQLEELEKVLKMNDPNRQLELGYSLVSSEDGLVRKVGDVEVGQSVDIKVSDGNINSEVKDKESSE